MKLTGRRCARYLRFIRSRDFVPGHVTQCMAGQGLFVNNSGTESDSKCDNCMVVKAGPSR